MSLFLRLEDVWLHPYFAQNQGSLAFSCLDKRVGEMNMSKINKIYVSDMLGDYGGTLGILAGSCLSDHSPIMLVSSEGRPCTVKATRIPAGVHTDAEVASQVEHIWRHLKWQSGSLGETMANRLQQISSFLLSEAESRLRRAREMERDLHWGIASIQRQLERHPVVSGLAPS